MTNATLYSRVASEQEQYTPGRANSCNYTDVYYAQSIPSPILTSKSKYRRVLKKTKRRNSNEVSQFTSVDFDSILFSTAATTTEV